MRRRLEVEASEDATPDDAAAPPRQGDRVRARFQDEADDELYDAIVATVHGTGDVDDEFLFDLHYDDGDVWDFAPRDALVEIGSRNPDHAAVVPPPKPKVVTKKVVQKVVQTVVKKVVKKVMKKKVVKKKVAKATPTEPPPPAMPPRPSTSLGGGKGATAEALPSGAICTCVPCRGRFSLRDSCAGTPVRNSLGFRRL